MTGDALTTVKSRHQLMLTIGVISDTHGLLRPQVASRLAGVAHIIHAGDIGREGILDELRRVAPVTAIRGNIDTDSWARSYPEDITIEIERRSIYVLHDLNELRFDPASRGVHVVISGHSHRPQIGTKAGVLFLNPGSAGPRRFSLPIKLSLKTAQPEAGPLVHLIDGAKC